MKRQILLAVTTLCVALIAAPPVAAFCGFYVAKADTRLFNEASQVAIARHDGKTVLTMANDYRGELEEFAIVIPVPTLLEREQINVADKRLLDHLDAYSSPRLVEYYDENPCRRRFDMLKVAPMGRSKTADVAEMEARARSLGVTIEAEYTVGEYDIVILSARESDGLTTFLKETGYKLPSGAERVLGSYIRQDMKFFLAKVNLEEQARQGTTYLRPLQVAFESPKFMLPIRLGTLNAEGQQELFVYTLTREGRVETTNYRTVKLPTDVDVPAFVKRDFGKFYKAMFEEQTRKHDGRVVFQEYAWNMAWCDPCAADPLSRDQLQQLGVFWLDESPQQFGGQAQQVFITRLHLRYDGKRFPEDLMFQETSDNSNFQGRYVVRHPFPGYGDCERGRRYREQLPERREKEAQTLANLTGWEIGDIRARMEGEGVEFPADAPKEPWWKRIWN
ncbi:hypothetical protein ABI59_20585 [Acidobacteria bacterium Mor1]|nr:hypothetical protein ABI59_20585 [Acidobacteria bacterium Mor1]